MFLVGWYLHWEAFIVITIVLTIIVVFMSSFLLDLVSNCLNQCFPFISTQLSRLLIRTHYRCLICYHLISREELRRKKLIPLIIVTMMISTMRKIWFSFQMTLLFKFSFESMECIFELEVCLSDQVDIVYHQGCLQQWWRGATCGHWTINISDLTDGFVHRWRRRDHEIGFGAVTSIITVVVLSSVSELYILFAQKLLSW